MLLLSYIEDLIDLIRLSCVTVIDFDMLIQVRFHFACHYRLSTYNKDSYLTFLITDPFRLMNTYILCFYRLPTVCNVNTE